MTTRPNATVGQHRQCQHRGGADGVAGVSCGRVVRGWVLHAARLHDYRDYHFWVPGYTLIEIKVKVGHAANRIWDAVLLAPCLQAGQRSGVVAQVPSALQSRHPR